MQKLEPFTYGNTYHLYNRGINSCNIFKKEDNYRYFLSLYEKYVDPIAETYAWVLMPNHFHFLVRTFNPFNPVRVQNPDGVEGVEEDVEGKKIGTPSQQFSKLFNAYAQAFNKRFNRHGSLFERPFKRKLIEDEEYLKNVLLYIHNNPVHHGFCDHAEEYQWSSYLIYLSGNSSKLLRKEVVEMFGDEANFKFCHEEKGEMEMISERLENKLTEC